MSEINLSFLVELQETVRECDVYRPDKSYLTFMFQSGLKRVVQTVNEDCGSVALAAVSNNHDRVISKSADALIDMLVLWRIASMELSDVIGELQKRHSSQAPLDCGDNTSKKPDAYFLGKLQEVILERDTQRPKGSYTTRLFNAGIGICAEKLDEEAGEVIVAALVESRDKLIEESADLIYHMMVLWRIAKIEFSEVVEILPERHIQRSQLALSSTADSAPH